ncbi:MAG: FAD-binding protein [Actinobacteria bacterium]|nr:FAD-binding protein [Actinomycetota bacterium]
MAEALYDRELVCDVLVVGSEGAGGPAAINAARAGLDVLIASKGKMSRCGASQMAGADFNLDGRSARELGLPGDDRDSPQRFFEDLVREGFHLGNQRMIEKYVEYAAKNTADLLEWGMPVYRFEQVHAEEMARGIITSGVKWVRILRRKVMEMGIRLVEDTMVVDLLTRDSRVIGAVALDLKSGEIVLIKARAVVLCTGGWQRAYHFNSASADLTGDGQAMAFRAGAQMIGMEMVQYVPATMIWPPLARKSILPYIMMETEVGPLVQLLNGEGERFMQRYDPTNLEQSTKEIVAIAGEMEVEEGRGSPHGGVYFALKHLTPEGVDYVWSKFTEFLDENNDKRSEFRKLLPHLLEMSKTQDLEVGNAAHFMVGGIKVDENTETGIPGLYAAGECSGGLWGSVRVASATTQVGAQGRIAGEVCPAYVKGVEHAEPASEQLEAVRARILAPLQREEGPSPVSLLERMHGLSEEYLRVIRDGEGLENAYDELSWMRRDEAPHLRVSASKSRKLNYEWQLCLELQNMLLCLEMSVLGSLRREESRGGFYRRDFPYTDNDRFCVNTVISNRDGEPSLRMEEPVVTTIPLPTGTMSFEEAVASGTASLKRGEVD